MNDSKTITLSGVLLSINGHGVLLRGNAASGKSELALSLLDRGHQLVADDRVKIVRQQQQLIGCAISPLVSGFIETRNLGILHADKLFDHCAVTESAPLKLIVELKQHDEEFDRINGSYQTINLLEIAVNQIFLAPLKQRRLDLLIEIALRQCQLRSEMHYDSSQHFCQQQQRMMAQQQQKDINHDYFN